MRRLSTVIVSFLLAGASLAGASFTALTGAASGLAQGAGTAPSLTDVTGVWTMQVESHQMGLELEQKGTKVEGVMLAMGQRILLVGTYVDRTLTLKGERPEGGSGSAPPPDSGAGPIVATMKDDGTLDGELSTQRGRAKWTGERLQKR